MQIQDKYGKLIKWAILIFAYVYLIYVLVNVDNYGVIFDKWTSSFYILWPWLVFIFLLLPLNLFFESRKWQLLLSRVQLLSLKQAFQSVLGGITTAFFTPNRVGEFPGRVLFLSQGSRTKGLMMGVVSAISQTLVIFIWGLPSAIVLFGVSFSTHKSIYFFVAGLSFIALLVIYTLLPRIAGFLDGYFNKPKLKEILHTLSDFSFIRLLKVLYIANLRYFVFAAQFYCMLRFFGVDFELYHMVLAIATNYLFVTFTPAFAFSEGAVRASIAVLVFGIFTQNTLEVALASLSLWLVNFVFPMLLGSVFVMKIKH